MGHLVDYNWNVLLEIEGLPNNHAIMTKLNKDRNYAEADE